MMMEMPEEDENGNCYSW